MPSPQPPLLPSSVCPFSAPALLPPRLQDFFKPRNIIIRLRDEEKWGPPQREALYKVGAGNGAEDGVGARLPSPRWEAWLCQLGQGCRRAAAPPAGLPACPYVHTNPGPLVPCTHTPCSTTLQGLEKYGVGKWRDMIQAFPELSRYKDTDVRVHAGRLLGTQSLARHVGWKGAWG